MLDPSIPGSEGFEFGRLMSAVHVNDELREKKDYIYAIVESPDVTREDYETYVQIINSKLPSERDATAIEKALSNATDACVDSW